jgi:hypothetical protein
MGFDPVDRGGKVGGRLRLKFIATPS